MTERSPFSIRPMKDGDEAALSRLWDRVGLTRGHNPHDRDIAFARGKTGSDILVGVEGNNLVASVLVGHDGHRGAVYYVAVDPDCRGKGHGALMMQAAEDWLKARGVWKLNLMVRESNTAVHGFYESLGYGTEPRTVFSKFLEEPPAPPQD